MMACELLAPAGNLQKLKLALYYGADAVYVGGKSFSLRSSAENFTETELAEGICYAHERGKKVYVAANIFARDKDFPALRDFFSLLNTLKADGVLVSDAGVFSLLQETAPDLPVHISTQANTCNARAVRFWKTLGAKRVVLARELSLSEISTIHAEVPDMELEAFVHGAMCISYSGRCYLSDYLAGRASNRGECSQPCRNRYTLLTEDGRSLSCEEDGRGSYLLNSKDLNMSAHLSELERAGVCSFKIEGRMKSEFYLATVVNAYRKIMDGDEGAAEELETIAHRAYTTAYAFGENHETVSSDRSQSAGKREFVALVLGWEKGRVRVEMRNRFHEGETLEILTPSRNLYPTVRVTALRQVVQSPTPPTEKAPLQREVNIGKFFCSETEVGKDDFCTERNIGRDDLCEKEVESVDVCNEEEVETTDAKLVQGIYTFDCPLPLQSGDILRRPI